MKTKKEVKRETDLDKNTIWIVKKDKFGYDHITPKRGHCLGCGKEWEAGIYCPECAEKLPNSGSCQIGANEKGES